MKYVVGIGIVAVIVGGGGFYFLGFSFEEEQQRVEESGLSANVTTDLFPPRVQHPVNSVPGKTTSFEEEDEIVDLDCSTFSCYAQHYDKMVKEDSIVKAFVDLKVRYDTTPFVRTQCHQLVHVIGRAATVQYPSVPEAYTQGDHFCWSGYYHGIMEGILREVAPEDLPETIRTICDDAPGKDEYTFDYFNCVHGLGHGVMFVKGNELFESLELCDELEGWWEQESCYGGAFMENVLADFGPDHSTDYLREDDLMYPCTAVEEKYKHQCYLMQTSYALNHSAWNFSKVFALCSRVEENHRDTCYQSIGRDASGNTVSDVERTKNFCLLGANERQQKNCMIGAVKDFISYFNSDVQAKQLCAAFPSTLQSECITTTMNHYKSFHN